MTLLAALISLISALSGIDTLRGGFEPSLRDDPLLQAFGDESQVGGTPGQMEKAGGGHGGGGCPGM
jgi:hypothetical protein